MSDPTMDPPAGALTLDDSKKLMTYLWTGILRPTTREAYAMQLGFSLSDGDEDQELLSLIDQLLQVYTTVQGHCSDFKTNTYPKIIGLASTIYDYAGTAGGTEDDSYYANILAAGKSLYQELAKPLASQNATDIQTYKDTIQGLIDAQVQAINGLRQQAKDAVQALGDFETIAKQDQKALQGASAPIHKKLEGEEGDGGEIGRITKEIKDKSDELRRDSAEYEKDIIIAATAVSYMWFFPVGTIAAAVTMGIYADKARKMKATMDVISGLIKSDEHALAVDIKVAADLHLIDADLTNVLNQIGPAITTISKMEGVWGAVADDLTAIGTAVLTQSNKGNLIVQKLSQTKIVHKWNDLQKEVDAYRKNAYVADDVKAATLDEAKQLYANAAQ